MLGDAAAAGQDAHGGGADGRKTHGGQTDRLGRTLPAFDHVRDMGRVGQVAVDMRPVGVLLMEDEAGGDEKIIAVPSSKLTQRYDKVKSYNDLPEITLQQIQHFFEHYKDLEPGKWVKVIRWGSADDAYQLISEGIARAKAEKK